MNSIHNKMQNKRDLIYDATKKICWDYIRVPLVLVPAKARTLTLHEKDINFYNEIHTLYSLHVCGLQYVSIHFTEAVQISFSE